MSKCLPMLQPVHEESKFTVLPTQQLGPHVLEREGKPMHSDDSPTRPNCCLSSPRFQRLFKAYLPIIKFLVCVFKIHITSFYSVIHLFFDYLHLCLVMSGKESVFKQFNAGAIKTLMLSMYTGCVHVNSYMYICVCMYKEYTRILTLQVFMS